MNPSSPQFLPSSVHSFEEIKKSLLEISMLSPNPSTEETVWFYITGVVEMLKAEDETSENFSLLESEKKVLSLLDGKTLKEWQMLQGNEATSHAERIQELEKQLLLQFQVIGSYLGITFATVSAYSLEECLQAFTQNKIPTDLVRIARSLKEMGKNEDAKELCEKLAQFTATGELFRQDTYTWEETIVVAMIAHTVYGKFFGLSEEAQKALLKNCFLRALAVGVPVREALQKSIYNTRTGVTYLLANQVLFDAIRENSEKIFGTEKVFSTLVREYLTFGGDVFEKQEKQDEFLKTVSIADAFVSALVTEGLSIAVHLKNLDLVEKNRGEELSDAEQYQNDVIQLLYMFGIGKDGQEELKKYFSGASPRVSLNSFFQRLRETVDLKDDVSIENMVEFTDFLHTNNFLPSDKELISFNEADGQFSWNEEIFTS